MEKIIGIVDLKQNNLGLMGFSVRWTLTVVMIVVLSFVFKAI